MWFLTIFLFIFNKCFKVNEHTHSKFEKKSTVLIN